jgi:hypothetical protein
MYEHTCHRLPGNKTLEMAGNSISFYERFGLHFQFYCLSTSKIIGKKKKQIGFGRGRVNNNCI